MCLKSSFLNNYLNMLMTFTSYHHTSLTFLQPLLFSNLPMIIYSPLDAIFKDLTKAFDIVDHHLLLDKPLRHWSFETFVTVVQLGSAVCLLSGHPVWFHDHGKRRTTMFNLRAIAILHFLETTSHKLAPLIIFNYMQILWFTLLSLISHKFSALYRLILMWLKMFFPNN